MSRLRSSALALLILTGCGHPDPTEPAVQKNLRTDCPLSQKDEYGYCIPQPPPPPCSLKDEHGNSYPNCIP